MLKTNWRSELVSLFLLVAMFLLAGVTWSTAPDEIPVHWGIGGEPDRYGGRFEGLLLAPLIALGIYGLLLVLPRIDPRRAHYERFSDVYALLRTAIVALLAGIHLIMVLWARDVPVDTALATPLMIGLLLMVIGNYLGKLRSTWFVGIRTPWTLSSEESWNKTHRLGGKLFVAVGLALVIASPFQNLWTLYAIGAMGLAALVLLTAYSYWVWRADPVAHR
jgi:uncharacterized membrane protein